MDRLPNWFHDARALAVIGMQWGDEGKGKLVDRLAAGVDVVVRFNGGANAGHSVQAGDQRLALHLVPCGILHEGVLNIVGNGVVADLEALAAEIGVLEAAGVPVTERLAVSDRAHLVLPYHKRADALYEAAAAAVAGEARKIGTTGRGIGPAYADKALRSTAVRAGDLRDPDALRARLGQATAVHNAVCGALAGLAGVPFEPFDVDALTTELLAQSAAIRPLLCDTSLLLAERLAGGAKVLFEGAHAALLDVDHGTYPYVTSSTCTAGGIGPGAGVAPSTATEVVGVVKAYQTRVGAGPMPTEDHGAIGQRLRDRGHEYGTTTGRPRRCGWLDLVALRHAVRVSGVTRLAVTLLDVLAGFKTLHACTGYRIDGELVPEMPADADALARATPELRSLEGFDEDLRECRTWDALPAAARAYLVMIEEQAGVPVSVVSVGPDRAETIMR